MTTSISSLPELTGSWIEQQAQIGSEMLAIERHGKREMAAQRKKTTRLQKELEREEREERENELKFQLGVQESLALSQQEGSEHEGGPSDEQAKRNASRGTKGKESKY